MVRFDPATAFEYEIRSSDRIGEASAAASRRRSRKRVEQAHEPFNPLAQSVFPSWARLPGNCAVDPRAASSAAFSAGAGLALLDATLRANPPFAGVLRQRLALRAAVARAAMARMRDDERDLRDAEHLTRAGDDPGPAGRIHRLWRMFASRPVRIDQPSLRRAADLLDLPQDLDLEALAGTVQNLAKSAENPLAAAAQAGTITLQALAGAPRADAEILALWFADLVLAKRLGWDAPVALIAISVAHPSPRMASSGGASNSRAGSGRRPRPDDPDWLQACAAVYAYASHDAYVMAMDIARRSEKLLGVVPKLRAKGAGRVVALLLADDCVSPAAAAKAAGLSDRAGRRLFDRLTELGAVRELSGRPSFRLYGL